MNKSEFYYRGEIDLFLHDSLHKNIVIKIPMTIERLKTVKVLSAKGIKTNATLIFSATQALLDDVIVKMAKHPLTDLGIDRFLKGWEAVPNK